MKQTCDFQSKCLRTSDNKADCACQLCAKDGKYSPVCGDDGKTYASQCELEKSSCEQKRNLKVAKKGACGELSKLNGLISISQNRPFSSRPFCYSAI